MTSMINAPSTPMAWQGDAAFRQHRTFCGLALPLSAPNGSLWSREAGGMSVTMDNTGAATSGEVLPLPAGRILRLLLLHIFTAALHSGNAAVEIGSDARSVALSLGLKATPLRLRELGEQLEYLIAAKLRITEGKGAPLSVLDARRSGNRDASSGWRPVLHLNKRFFASLQQSAVALDRDVVAALAGSAMALDAYAWLAATLPEVSTDRPMLVTWTELQQRFGQDELPGAVAFRTAFSKSLKAVQAAYPALWFMVSQDGVELQGAAALAAAPAMEPAVPTGSEPEPNKTSADMPTSTVTGSPRNSEPLSRADRPATTPARVGFATTGEASVPEARPQSMLNPVQASAALRMTHEIKPILGRERGSDRIRLAPALTGLGLSVWLRRGAADTSATLEVTPGAEYNPARRSLLILEPMILQVAGSLRPHELEQVAAWASANAELIQDYWDGSTTSISNITGRVRPVSTASW